VDIGRGNVNQLLHVLKRVSLHVIDLHVRDIMEGIRARKALEPPSLLTGTSVQGPTVTETPLEVGEALSEGQPTRDDTETQNESGCAVPNKDDGKEDGTPTQDRNTMDKGEELMHSGLM
jgi:hypothetical protein